MSTWEDELVRCPLAAGPFPPGDRRCDWCGTGLEGRRRRWCSDDCSNAYSRNHAWTSARAAALARDGHRCVRCGSDGRHPVEFWFVFVMAVCPSPRGPGLVEWCRANGWMAVESNEARAAYWHHVDQANRPWSRAREIMSYARRRAGLEVNHKTPCRGAHKDNSCAHHIDGLETLCHACHVSEANRQRRAGLLA